MKTILTSAPINKIRQIIAGLSLSIALLVGGSAAAQTNTSDPVVSFADNAAIHTQSSDQFKVAVFPIANSQIMKVVLENPNKEQVTVLIRDSKNEIVYSKGVGSKAVFIGKFDVSSLTDGNYTMVIESAKQSYSNPFSLQLQQERIAKAF